MTDLKKFLAPSTVALVGATEELNRFGGRCLQRLLSFGYKGRAFPINPRYKVLQGLACYPSILDVPEAPDHVGVVVPAERVLGVLQDCAKRGARFATVYTGGFAEAGTEQGLAMQRDITAFSRESGMRVMGPNCNGVINFVDAFAMTTTATIAGPRKPAGTVGIVSQSGGLAQVNVMWRAQELGIGVSYEVSCGNCADLNVLDFLEFMIDDDASDVVLVLAEHIGDGARLIELAGRAADREKPIVMLKLGRSEAGSLAAASHTGAVTGPDAVADAVLRQSGIVRVMDAAELYEYAMLLRTKRWPRGRRAAATTISGGNGVLLVDLGATMGITWPEYSVETQSRLGEWLPKLGTSGNPTDVTNAAIGKQDLFRRCIEIIAQDDSVDVVIPIFTMAAATDLQQAVEAARCAQKPVAVLWAGGCSSDPTVTAKTLIEQGVPVYRNTLACLQAVRASMQYGGFLRERRERKADRPSGADRTAALKVLGSRRGGLTERESKEVLAAYGFTIMREALAANADEAVRIARNIEAPVALKIESPDIPHKTEANAIRLNVQGDAAVRSAFDEIIAASRRYAPNARLNGVLVQPMAAAGLEVMLGLASDPVFGPIVVTGLGGIFVEVLHDVSYRAVPVGRAEARAMLEELRGSALLQGVRGGTPRDIEALCDHIVRLSWLGHDLRDHIAELDINPLVVLERARGVCVVDALVVARNPRRQASQAGAAA
ncbi:MAG: acetate--CoA ligase family protein [Burkholderiales bacterium]